MSAYQAEFRPFERRCIDGRTSTYKHFTPTGSPDVPLPVRPFTTSKNLLTKQEVVVLRLTEESRITSPP